MKASKSGASRSSSGRAISVPHAERGVHADVAPMSRWQSAVDASPQAASAAAVQRLADRRQPTGLPATLQAGVERLSGLALDDVRVHYRSQKPAALHALAFTRGTEIHIAPGQEKQLPHEAWHVVQQAQGRVAPTGRVRGQTLNDAASLEREADVMGTRALQTAPAAAPPSAPASVAQPVTQLRPIKATWRHMITDKDGYDAIVGSAKNTSELSVEQLERLVALLEREPQPYVSNTLKGELQAEHGGPAPPDTEEALAAERGRESDILRETLAGLGGTWEGALPAIEAWFEDLKQRESGDTFQAAFMANRMTARQVNIDPVTSRGGPFDVPRTSVPGSNRQILLARGVDDIVARGTPEHFFDPSTGGRRKNELGLHALSASLLDSRRPISDQLKRYESAVVLFMPLPEERDVQMLAALSRLQGYDRARVRQLRSQVTRPVLAQASDMGTSFVDVSEPGAAQGKFRYGVTGTLIRRRGGIGVPATRPELAARRTNALIYKSVLAADITKVNEIVLAYREHESSLFPMFAAWDPDMKIFLELRPDLTPTGMSITDDGRYREP